jgi:hypothetical protein
MDNVVESYRQQLQEFYSSEYAQMTVKELLTGTTNIVLPTAVQAKAILVLKNFIDARELCMRAAVPKGSGKTVEVQVITRPDYDDWTEGSALSAGDPTLAKKSITLASFGKVTKISDLLANTSAINFVETIGQVHGACVRQGILDKIVDGMAGASSPNSVEVGTAADATEADFDFSHVTSAIEANLVDGFTPDFILTAPDKLWTCFTTDYDKKQFYGALADLLVSGRIPRILGLDWYMDPYFELAINAGSAWDGTDGEKYAIVGTKGVSGIWAALQETPVVEIYRVGTELSNYIVTHIDGGADEGPDESICIIKHAA